MQNNINYRLLNAKCSRNYGNYLRLNQMSLNHITSKWYTVSILPFYRIKMQKLRYQAYFNQNN